MLRLSRTRKKRLLNYQTKEEILKTGGENAEIYLAAKAKAQAKGGIVSSRDIHKNTDE